LKRVTPLFIAGVRISVALGGKAAWTYWSPYSSYNRLNTLEEWRQSTEERNAALENVTQLVLKEQTLAREVRNMAGQAFRSIAERQHQLKQGIIDLAHITPNIASETTQIANTMNGYRDGLAKIRASCASRHRSVEELNKFARLDEFRQVKEMDVYIDEIRRLDCRSFSLSLHIDVARKNAQVFHIYGRTSPQSPRMLSIKDRNT